MWFCCAQLKHISIKLCSLIGESLVSTISSANPKFEIIKFWIFAPNPDSFNVSSKSLMKIINSKGPSLLPYITPEKMLNCGERYCPSNTLALLLEYISLITLSIFPRIPNLYSFSNRISRGTLSKAFRRSIKHQKSAFFKLLPRLENL